MYYNNIITFFYCNKNNSNPNLTFFSVHWQYTRPPETTTKFKPHSMMLSDYNVKDYTV